jgi:hypothetical protein
MVRDVSDDNKPKPEHVEACFLCKKDLEAFQQSYSDICCLEVKTEKKQD